MEVIDKVKIIGIGFDGLELRKRLNKQFVLSPFSKGITKNPKQEFRVIDEVLWNSSDLDYLIVPKKIVIALDEL
jgi:hypothetical protein|tara:strand:+ start:71 stop:292 length:222 start_codon:yes stop_codon:yes gene_type:complete